MALFEQTPPSSGSRFGKLSPSMFFTRNTAKPKRVRHIEGIGMIFNMIVFMIVFLKDLMVH